MIEDYEDEEFFEQNEEEFVDDYNSCLLYTSPSPRD